MEIVNDSYMKVLDSLKGFDHSRPFKSWYGRILVNTAIDNYRKNLKSNEHISIDTISEAGESDPEIETELSVNDILTLYRYLPANYKMTFNLFEIEGYSHEEIGRMMGVTASTSRANLTRAKKLLRELYSRHIISARKSHE
jgi:RNA polymerase sigma-70 factor (ECF subfamily)